MVQESSAKYIDTIVALTNLMSLSFQGIHVYCPEGQSLGNKRIY